MNKFIIFSKHFFLIFTLCLPQLINASQPCDPLPPHCTICTDADKKSCEACESDAYVVLNNVCNTCIDAGLNNCMTCSSPSICTKCQDSFYIKDSVCKTCSSLYAFEECAKCTESECLECKPGSYLHKPHFCLFCPAFLSNCVECTAIDKCKKCQSGFFVFEDNCKTCAVGCSECISEAADKCTICSAGFYLDKNSCKPCPTGCTQCSNTGQCSSCYNTHFLDEGMLCKPCDQGISNCKICSDKSTCTTCNDGFTTTDNKVCIACVSPCKTCSSEPSKCTSCVDDTGLVLDKCQTNDCKSNTNASYTFASLPNNCTDCKIGQIINKAICKIPLTPIITTERSGQIITATIDCKNKAKAILLYSLADTIDLYDVNQAEILVDSIKDTRNKTERSVWLRYEAVSTDDNGKAVYQLKNVKNSGETFNLVLFCKFNDGTWSKTKKSFETLLHKMSGFKIIVYPNRNLTKLEKQVVAKNIQKALQISNEIFTDEGDSTSNTLNSGRILQNSYKTIFYVIPNYSNDGRHINILDFVYEETKYIGFPAKILPAGITGTVESLTESNMLGGSIKLLNSYPKANITDNEIRITFKLIDSNSKDSNITVYYQKLDNFSNNTISLLDYDSFLLISSKFILANSTIIWVSQKEVNISYLEKATSYQLYYYVQTLDIPIIRSAVYGQIVTTTGTPDPDGLINLKIRYFVLIIIILIYLI